MKKHQESCQKHNIILNLYLGKSYRRYLRGTCSWECLRPIADLFQWTSYWNYIFRNRFEESYGNIRRTENILQAVSFNAAVDVRVNLHCEVLPISCTEVGIVAVAAGKVFPQSGLACNLFTNNNSNNITHTLRNGYKNKTFISFC